MRLSRWFLVCLVASVGPSARAQAPPAGGATDVYFVHFVQAAAGKTAELEKALVAPATDGSSRHTVVFRHVEGSPWDYLLIEHYGTSATIQPVGTAPERELRATHEDTYVAGPSWDTFAKAMGIGSSSGANGVYIVSTYRGAPGHRQALEDTLRKLGTAAAKPGTEVVFRHLDGAAWDYLVIAAYDSWQALAADQTDPGAEERVRKAGFTKAAGLELRDHMSFHNDTIATRIMAR